MIIQLWPVDETDDFDYSDSDDGYDPIEVWAAEDGTKLSKRRLEARRKSPLDVASGKSVHDTEISDEKRRTLQEREAVSSFLKENILTEQRILNGKNILVIIAMWINYYYSAGRLRLFKETQYAVENTASRRYFDEIKLLDR